VLTQRIAANTEREAGIKIGEKSPVTTAHPLTTAMKITTLMSTLTMKPQKTMTAVIDPSDGDVVADGVVSDVATGIWTHHQILTLTMMGQIVMKIVM